MLKLESHSTTKALSIQESRSLSWLKANPGMVANISGAFTVPYKIDANLIRAGVEKLVVRHAALRTSFRYSEEDVPYRHIVDTTVCAVEELDTSAFLLNSNEIQAFLSQQCERGFGKDADSLFRVFIAYTSDGQGLLIVNMAHLISDAISCDILLRELWQSYTASKTNQDAIFPEPKFSLSDYVESQKKWTQSPDFSRQLDSVCRQLSKSSLEIEQNELPDLPSKALAARPATMVSTNIDTQLTELIKQKALDLKVSIFVVLLALTSLSLAKIFNRKKYFLVFAFENRMLPELKEIVGFFANVVPIFIDVTSAKPFDDYVTSLNASALKAMHYGSIPFGIVSEKVLGSSSDRSIRNTFNDYMFNFIPPSSEFCGVNGEPVTRFAITRNGNIANEIQIIFKLYSANTLIMAMRVPAQDRTLAETEYKACFERVATMALNQSRTPITEILDLMGKALDRGAIRQD